MKLIVAIHEIIRGTEPKSVAPGKSYQEDDKVADQLIRAGAARLAEAEEPVTGKLAGVVDGDGGTRNLQELKKAELLEIAKGMEIEGADGMTKAELIAAIEAEEVEVQEAVETGAAVDAAEDSEQDLV